jgi:DNA polymerase I-like protein with 3'-5' exonuclease and polymerase domains
MEPEVRRLPPRTKIGKELLEAFSRPPEGYVLVEPDYSAIELRIYAEL